MLVGIARARDRAGRPLPAWFGCRKLRSGELFTMNPAAPDSFDGRYFGTLKIEAVIGCAMPVWTDEAGDGDHVWFAQPPVDELSHPSKGALPLPRSASLPQPKTALPNASIGRAASKGRGWKEG